MDTETKYLREVNSKQGHPVYQNRTLKSCSFRLAKEFPEMLMTFVLRST